MDPTSSSPPLASGARQLSVLPPISGVAIRSPPPPGSSPADIYEARSRTPRARSRSPPSAAALRCSYTRPEGHQVAFWEHSVGCQLNNAKVEFFANIRQISGGRGLCQPRSAAWSTVFPTLGRVAASRTVDPLTMMARACSSVSPVTTGLAALSAARRSRSQPSAGALLTQVTLKLAQGAEQVKEKASSRRGGADRLGDGAEPDAAWLLGIPLDPDSMARCFTLSRADQELVAKRRRDANRIGFAVQPALLGHPGISLTQLEQPDEPLVQWLARRLEIPAAPFAGYARRHRP